jgi:2-keto-4-pentenoate hydratase
MIEQAAQAIWNARVSRTPIPPLRQWMEPTALDLAYAVQKANHERKLMLGAKRIGRKIGLTAVAVQKQLGVDQPDFGALFDDMLYHGPSAQIAMTSLIQPRIEGELAFIVAQDITEAGLPRSELAKRAGDAAAAFEIVDSAIADWKITFADTVADNASCGAIVLGVERLPVATTNLRLAGMVMSEGDAIVSLGVGAASLGDPLASFAWLAEQAIRLGDPIRAGEVVLTGALGPMVPFRLGHDYRLEIAGFQAISVSAI